MVGSHSFNREKVPPCRNDHKEVESILMRNKELYQNAKMYKVGVNSKAVERLEGISN